MRKTIEDILDEQGFTSKEKEAFLEIIKEAKLLQQTTMLEDLKPFMNKKINEVAFDETKEY